MNEDIRNRLYHFLLNMVGSGRVDAADVDRIIELCDEHRAECAADVIDLCAAKEHKGLEEFTPWYIPIIDEFKYDHRECVYAYIYRSLGVAKREHPMRTDFEQINIRTPEDPRKKLIRELRECAKSAKYSGHIGYERKFNEVAEMLEAEGVSQ